MTTRAFLIAGGITFAVLGLARLDPFAGAGVVAGDDGVKDLIVGRIGGGTGTDFKEYGTFGGISAYAFGTTSCNNGTELLSWRNVEPYADQHPVIAQNLYRLADGRFEQIGMSWVKHGFCAADSMWCGPCEPADGCQWLGVGCSDVYGASTNAQHAGLGPRSEVDASTGAFAWPHALSTGETALRGRLQVRYDDVDPAQNPGASYVGEAQYVTPDDAGTATANNNNAYRPVIVGDLVNHVWDLRFESGPTVQQRAAIEWWAAVDPEVSLAFVDVPGDGRFIVGSRCSDNGDGTWHYEYAVFNMNSHRAAGGFDVPLPPGVAASAIGFHDVDYHSGELYTNDDWPGVAGDGLVSWETEAFAVKENANALRFSTLYNFRFDADAAPAETSATLRLFRPRAPGSVPVAVCGPGGPEAMPGDVDGDGRVDAVDLATLLAAWGACPAPCAADFDGDGSVGFGDLLVVLSNWTG